jgi:DNA-binding MarR family transcriptional regulator
VDKKIEIVDSTDVVIVALRQIIRAVDLQSKKLVKKCGLTGPQLIVLKEVRKSYDYQVSEIAHRIHLSQATVTSILDRLERQGFAVRQRNEKDKRKVNISLTEKAEQILDHNYSFLQEEFSERFAGLEEWEKSMILSALQRLVSILKD